MTLSIKDLNLRADPPELPESVPVPTVEAVPLDTRRRAIDVFVDRFSLGRPTRAEMIDSVVFASERGEIEYFPASGAMWARMRTDSAHENELRKWDGLERVKTDTDVIYQLNREMSQRIVDEASELLDSVGFVEEEQNEPRVLLDQVAQLDERGETIQSGAGAATVSYDYSFAGQPVYGAGAKTQVFVEPGRRGIQVTGGFHVWRKVVDTHRIAVGGIERALAVGVLQDPELMLYHERGGQIEASHLAFGYLALPAMVRQAVLIPAFQIEGRVHLRDSDMEYFEFARYHHAISPDQYAEAGMFDHYLSVMN